MAHLYTGRDGFMRFGQNQVAKVTSFSLQGDLELLEATSLRDSVKSFVPGLQSFSGSATILYYRDGPTNPGITLLNTFIKSGTAGVSDTVNISFRFEARDGQSEREITFDAYITSASLGASVGEVSSAQISFTAKQGLEIVGL